MDILAYNGSLPEQANYTPKERRKGAGMLVTEISQLKVLT